MKYKCLVIADADTLLGFGAAGVPGLLARDRGEALAALRAAEKQEPAVIIIAQEVADMIRAEVDALRFAAVLPLVAEIPGAGGPQAGRRALADVIREAIGISV